MNNSEKYTRNLELVDLFFAGFGFIIGAGIFTLIPLIIKYGKGNSWLSFVIGGFVCLLTGLSYARLNQEYPVNDAEYSWIYEILNFNKEENKEPHFLVKQFANVIIWIVMIIGLFNTATVAVGLSTFIRQYINVPQNLMVGLSIALPSLINTLGNKYSTLFNKSIIGLVVSSFVVLMGLAGVKGKFLGQNELIPNTKNLSGLFRSSFITIFAFNGFQSIVQLSEETKNISDIPKGIYSSLTVSTIIYALVAVSVIGLLGINKATNSINPIATALGKLIPGTKIDYDIINAISSIALFNTLMLIILSRSRLLQKLSVRGLAPKIFKKLTNLGEIFGIENFKTDKNSEKVTIPILAIVAVSVVSYLLTFVGQGAIESLASITNGFIFFVFIIVNLLVIINHYKKKKKNENDNDNKNESKKKLPWYAFLGTGLSLVYFYKSFSYQ